MERCNSCLPGMSSCDLKRSSLFYSAVTYTAIHPRCSGTLFFDICEREEVKLIAVVLTFVFLDQL